jgi:hypothetical protein
MTTITVFGHTARQIRNTYNLSHNHRLTMTVPVTITYCTVEGRDKVTFTLPEALTE